MTDHEPMMYTLSVIRRASLTVGLILSLNLSLSLALRGVSVARSAEEPSPAMTQARFAMIIGANVGLKSEEVLRFAERDALQVSKVLSRFGGTPSLNQVVLLSPSLSDVKRGVSSLKQRLEALPAKTSTTLTVYYSGHADARAFHVSSERLTFTALRAMLNDLPTSLTVILIDACRSGAFTRLKGARPGKPFKIKTAPLEVKGVAVISSSSPQEDSQESDISRGGIFTQHLITGLMGAADRTRDHRVSLNEIYEYTYRETVKSTSDTPTIQHPHYSLSIKGEREVILTELNERRGFAQVTLSSSPNQSGVYLLIPHTPEQPLSELNLKGAQQLLVHPGSYLVRYRDRSGLYERPYRLSPSQATRISPRDLRQIPYGESVRRGRTFYTQNARAESAWSLSLSSEIQSALSSGMGSRLGGSVQLDRHSPQLSLHLKLGGRYSEPSARDGADFRQYEGDVALGLGRSLDLSYMTLYTRIWAGLLGAQQRFDADANIDELTSWIGALSPELGLQRALTPRLYISVGGSLYLWFLQRDAQASGSDLDAEIGWGATLSLGSYL